MNAPRTLIPVAKCEEHPILASQPLMPVVLRSLTDGQASKEENREVEGEIAHDWAAFVANIKAAGVLEPLVAVRTGGRRANRFRIIDGRHRFRAAIEAGLKSIPVRCVAESEVSAVIESAIIGRRHITKSIKAWQAVALHPELIEGSHGERTDLATSRSENGKLSREDAAARYGVSPESISRAAQLWKRSAKKPKARAMIIQQLGMGRGFVEAARAAFGLDEDSGSGDAGPNLVKKFTWFRGAVQRAMKDLADFSAWPPAQQEEATAFVAEFVAGFPAEWKDELSQWAAGQVPKIAPEEPAEKPAEPLFECPKCHRRNFTAKGLKNHTCKAD